jgi:glycosyltransferase involved in cell wall biosynthesis
VSCQKIVSNLLKAYEALGSELELVPINYMDGMDEYEFTASCHQMADALPDFVIFMDHRPHPVGLLDYVIRQYKERGHTPHYIFHLYGDFSLTFGQWKKLEKTISGQTVLWYAASERQRNMLSEYIPVEQLRICPFPVDAADFYPAPGLRDAFRREKGWADDETVFIFTGRLSRQKRIHQLIDVFAAWKQRTGRSARLVLVGDVDKIGDPFLLQSEMEGEYFQRLWHKWQSLDPALRACVEFHGFRPNKELLSYYSAADVFVNISVHNDEDYGMSCAEALACGMPLILTDWAGFSSFRIAGIEQHVRMVPVRLSRRGKLVSLKALEAHFEACATGPAPDRAEIAAKSLAYAGLKNVTRILRGGLREGHIFREFLPTLHEAANLETYQRWCTFADRKNRAFNDLFMKVYRHYVE